MRSGREKGGGLSSAPSTTLNMVVFTPMPMARVATVARHIRPATLLAAQLLGDRDDTEDVVQDAFIVVLRRAADFHGGMEAAFRAWLFGIVRRLALKTRARASRRLRLRQRWGGGVVSVAEPQAHANLAAEEVRAMMATMPPMQRACCELAFIHGLSSDEISDMHNIATSTVRQHIFRGRRLLRAALSPDQSEEPE